MKLILEKKGLDELISKNDRSTTGSGVTSSQNKCWFRKQIKWHQNEKREFKNNRVQKIETGKSKKNFLGSFNIKSRTFMKW